jgi:daunorubicin resistance ABC transporter ATP-binding subunit
MANIIETRQLVKSYNSLVAVDNLDLNVEAGEIFALLGPNGAGKTTTLKMLCTILKPTSGIAKVNGFDIVKEPNQVRKSIGIVFQDPSIDDMLTGRENLQIHAYLYGVPGNKRRERIDKILKVVELEDRADDLLRTYSGGMRRRLELGRGLLHNPKILFLDEPTVGLDPQTRDHIWTYIRELREVNEVTVVLTTHYMDEADKLSDRIGIIDHGKLVTLDTAPNLKETLAGDVITVKTRSIDDFSRIIAEELGYTNQRVVDNALQITVHKGRSVVPKLVVLATRYNIEVDSIGVDEPNLEDVFLHYTGKTIRQDSTRELYGMAAIQRRQIR